MQMQCNVKLSPLLHLSQSSIALFSQFQNFPVNLTKWFVHLNNGTAIIDRNNTCLPLSVFTSLVYYIFNLLIIKQFSRKILRRKLHQVEVGDIQHKNKLTPYLGRKLRGVVHRLKNEIMAEFDNEVIWMILYLPALWLEEKKCIPKKKASKVRKTFKFVRVSFLGP